MKKAIRTILLIVCICVFCYSAYNLINIYLNYKKIDDDYGELANTYTSVKDEKKEEQNYLQIDWATLKERNNDVKAWIQIPDTNVNYPVLQGETNDTYIHSDIDHQKLSAGSIFVDCRNEKPFEDFNTVIYGHNMKNDTMFGQLDKFKDSYFAEENIINIISKYGEILKYKVFSVYVSDNSTDYLQTKFNSQNEYEIFINKIKEKSIIENKTEVTLNDKILTLSTCSDDFYNARTVVHAKLIV